VLPTFGFLAFWLWAFRRWGFGSCTGLRNRQDGNANLTVAPRTTKPMFYLDFQAA